MDSTAKLLKEGMTAEEQKKAERDMEIADEAMKMFNQNMEQLKVETQKRLLKAQQTAINTASLMQMDQSTEIEILEDYENMQDLIEGIVSEDGKEHESLQAAD